MAAMILLLVPFLRHKVTTLAVTAVDESSYVEVIVFGVRG